MKAIGKIVSLLALVTLLSVMVRCTTLTERQTEPAGSPPVITHYFAVEKLSHGDTWKIYLEAEDPDGDMGTIKYSISSGGYRPSFKSFVIKKDNRARLFGYLEGFFSSPITAVAEWTELTLTLYIRDKRGNTSDKVVFPLAVSRRVKQGPPPPPFDKGGLKGLGVFWVKLYAPVE